MKKKLLLAVVIVLALLGIAALYFMNAPRPSPKGVATSSAQGLDLKVDYSRPFKKGRVIFGEAGALVPYGKYWRLGANEPTVITFGKAVTFAGKPMPAGTYRLYAFPGASSWKIVLNSVTGGWGASEPNHEKDVLTVEVPAETAKASVEQLSLSFLAEPLSLEIAWDTTVVHVPIAAGG